MSDHQRHRDAELQRRNEASAKGRDIGGIPLVGDPDRRESCRLSLRLFCETYNPEAFHFGWSGDHLEAIARIEEAAITGALYAFAMPRGSGKTTICRMAALWVLSYAHRRYPFIIGANAPKAQDTLDAIKTFMRYLPEWGEDFPEIAYPVRRLEGIAHRAAGQTCGGESTMIAWAKDQITLPTVNKPANWRAEWGGGKSDRAPTAGAVISVSGLTGDGIRGSVKTLATGEQIRPDFVLLDDPQTDESAASLTQNESRERLISGAVLGMAGPGRRIAAVMPCTVIYHDDMADRLLDRVKHPLWRGTRTKMLTEMPSNLDAWEAYREVYIRCAQQEPPDYAESNAYYAAHREALDAGALAAWDERKEDDEVSAIQHAMHLWLRDPDTFMAEYQNEPVVDASAGDAGLTAGMVRGRLCGLPEGVCPADTEHVTAFVDVGKWRLHYAVVAWSRGAVGSVIAYGTEDVIDPDRVTVEVAILQALRELKDRWESSPWEVEGGGTRHADLCMVDAGNWNTAIYEFVREAGKPWMAAMGLSAWRPKETNRKQGIVAGDHYYQARQPNGLSVVNQDHDYWVKWLHDRWLTSPYDDNGEHRRQGSMALWGGEATVHMAFARHQVSEMWTIPQVGPDGKAKRGYWRKSGPNHWLDCMYGASVAGHLVGVRLVDQSAVRGGKRKRATGAWSR